MQCETIQLSNEIHEWHLRHQLASDGPPKQWIPPRRLASYEPLPSNWEAYFVSSSLPKPTPPAAEVYGIFSEALSPILTILAHLPPRLTSTSTIVLHFLSVDVVYDNTFLAAFEEVLHRLPSLVSLKIFIIAPTLPALLHTDAPLVLPSCPECKAEGCTKELKWVEGAYEEVGKDLPSPDMIISYQGGLSLLPEDSQLALYLRGTGVPLLFTAMTEEEANDDCKYFEEKGESSLGVRGVERNIWASGWPRVDGWEEDGVWRRNGFVWSLE